MFTKNFKELGKTDADIAGGKGASLGEMTQAGIPVPPGFVVLSDAFEHFLKETELHTEIDSILHKVDHKKIHTVENASEEIKALILEAKMPKDIASEVKKEFEKLNSKYVAVRSSATAEDSSAAAWAGQLESYLNTTEKELLQNVQKCWASLFTPRAIFYRFEKGLHEQHISVAVVVQKMVESEVSGIAFSVHPVTQDYNQLIIEAGLGLGEAIVSGSITPDSYVVEKDKIEIIEKNISEQSRGLFRTKQGGGNEWRDIPKEVGEKQVLSDKQISELSNLILKIEDHYAFPCDIEWAYEKGKFYIDQSRPITTLTKKEEISEEDILKPELTKELRSIDWHVDWSGTFPLVEYSMADEVYFNAFNKVFGTSFTKLLILARNGVATGRYSEDEYKKIGEFLLKKGRDIDYVKQWAIEYKRYADKLMNSIKAKADKFLENLESFHEDYQFFGAYTVGTKIFFDFVDDSISKKAKDLLEEARKHSEPFYWNNAKAFERAAELIAHKSGYDPKEVLALTREELYANVGSQKLPPRDILKERGSYLGLYWNKEGQHFLSRAEIDDIESYWLSQTSKETIKGTTAYKGKITGKCRLILDYRNAYIEEGEILVTGMTNPNYTPLVKKAAAIITDGGGMLSHAAIISRELKKPCVIDTKIATQILKDGMEVEVDADKGVVRILESGSDINPSDYHFFGLWKCNLFSDWYWTRWLVPEYAERIGLDLKDGGIFVINGGYFFAKKSVIETIRRYAKDIIKNKDEQKIQILKKITDEIYRTNISIAKKLSNTKPTEKNLREITEAGRKIMFPWCFGYILSEVFDEFLVPVAEKAGVKKEDISSLIPPFKTPLIEAQENLQSIKKNLEDKGYWKIILEDSSKAINKIKKDKKIIRLIKEHSEKYGWSNIMNLVGEDPNIEQVIDQITHLPPEHNHSSKNKINGDLKFLIECASVTAYLRQTGVEYFSIYSRHTMQLLKSTANKIKVSYRELLDLNLDEIISGINGLDVKKIIKKRANDKWIIYSSPDNEEPKTIDDLEINERLAKEMIPRPKDSDNDTIVGQVGNKGKGTGKVKIILSLEDFHKMESGDVLVTTMTTPDFVPLMQKSSAIITDIGGLLCHAAIISRELNIPCVIGTKFATQILKDGMEVEVDADKGIVKIVK